MMRGWVTVRLSTFATFFFLLHFVGFILLHACLVRDTLRSSMTVSDEFALS
jgi:hypothetical protein